MVGKGRGGGDGEGARLGEKGVGDGEEREVGEQWGCWYGDEDGGRREKTGTKNAS